MGESAVIGWIGRLFRCPHDELHRERRDIAGVSVPHWVCQQCGHIKPIVGRDFYEFEAHAKVRPAHESMKAKRTPAPIKSITKWRKQ